MSDLVIVSERRRSWPEELKRKLLAEAEQPGENICRVARRHDMEPAQLYQWRKKFRDQEVDQVRLMPVEITETAGSNNDEPPAAIPTQHFDAPQCATRLEIACKNGRHLFAPIDIEPHRLSQLVSALEAS